jgi:hypothetical protein
MKVGIHELERGLLSDWTKKYIKILEYNNIKWELLSLDDKYFWEKVKTCSHFIYHWGAGSDSHQKAHAIIPVIEQELKIPVFPGWNLSWHFDDKIKGFYLLKAYEFPVINTSIFYNKTKAKIWIKNIAQFPVVFKLSRGAGSSDVVLVKTQKHAMRITKRMFNRGIISGGIPGNDLWLKQFNIKKITEKYLRAVYRKIRGYDANRNYYRHKNYVLFQEFLPENKYDTRITTIGDRAFAFRRFNRSNDFRASGSGKIDYNVNGINTECVKIALDISSKIQFSCMTYDFLFDKNNKPQIAEISYTFNDLAVYKCTGFWDKSLVWHDGHFWPEFLQLLDFLNLPDLNCPKFD